MNETTTLESVDKKVDFLDRKIENYRESIVTRFNSIEEGMDEGFLYMKAGFSRIDDRFEAMDGKFDSIQSEIREGFARLIPAGLLQKKS